MAELLISDGITVKVLLDWPIPDLQSHPQVLPFLPEACRRAGKAIANEPELWCQGAWQRDTDGGIRLACALGQTEAVLLAEFGRRAIGADWITAMNRASLVIDPDKCGIAGFNDNPAATPQTVADHLFAVADVLEFDNPGDLHG